MLGGELIPLIMQLGILVAISGVFMLDLNIPNDMVIYLLLLFTVTLV